MPNTIQDQIQESVFRLAWERRLGSANPARSLRGLRPDTAALARMEMINRRLATLNARLVLITGDEAMHRVASEYHPLDEAEGDFAQLYLRHPKAFLSSTQILARGEESPFHDSSIASDLIVNWLDSLLVRYMNYDGPKATKLKSIANEPDGKMPERIKDAAFRDPKAVGSIRSQWRRHTAQVITQHSLSSSIARTELTRILGEARMGGVADALDRLDRRLLSQSEITWQSFFRAVVHAGFDIALGEKKDNTLRNRNAPGIAFDSFPATKSFVQRALKNAPSYDLRADLSKCLPTIEKEDQFGYATMLAYATLHAFGGNWYVAKLLAYRAISIAKRMCGDDKANAEADPYRKAEAHLKISGREAYYFAAVAERHCARTADELAPVGTLLDEAELALKKDKSRKQPTGVDNLRFEAERKALELTRILFDRFGAGGYSADNARARLEVLCKEFGGIADKSSSTQDAWIGSIVERNALTNLFMAKALIEGEIDDRLWRLSFRDEPDSANQTQFSKHFQSLLRNLTAGGNDGAAVIAETRLVWIIRLFATARYGQLDLEKRRELRRELEDFEARINDAGHRSLVMPYDQKRFSFLIEISRKIIDQRSSEFR
jgi:hypothetical protein